MSSNTITLNMGKSYKPNNPENSIFRYPDAMRIKGSVLFTILPQVTFMTLFAAVNVICKKYWNLNFSIPNSIVPSLSVVIGLLLVFRTNTAYDRYYEGRRLWTTIKTSVRNLSRTIYFIPTPTPEQVQQKIDALKLLVAFSNSVKDYLRDESDKNHVLIDDLLSPRLKSDKFNALEADFSENIFINGYGAISNSPTNSTSSYRTIPDLTNPLASLPLEIATDLNTYTNKQRQENLTDPQTNNQINTIISSLVDCLGGLERIRRTPIPLAYTIHMKQVVFLYCATLPFTLADLGWWSVALTGVVAFVLNGIDGIGQQIEDPFGYDDNDLPLDQICYELKREIEFTITKISNPTAYGLKL